MRIHDAYRSIHDATSARAFAAAKPAPAASDGKPATKVTLSQRARELASGGDDAQRVADLRSAIRDGTFQVDAHAIAQKLVGASDEDGDGT